MRGNDGHQCLTELIIAIWKMFSFSFSFQWCFFFCNYAYKEMEDHAPHYACCELSCFFFTEVSQMKERNLVNSVHDDMLMTFPLDFGEFFFQLGLRGNGRLQATLCRLWFLVVFSHGSIDQINRRRMISGRTFTKC